MSVVALTTVFLLNGLPGQFPDALDHLRAGDVIPQVGLLLDRSGSMGWGDAPSECTWFANQCPSGHPEPIWGWSHCRPDCPCDDYAGDCDNDSECKSGYCAHNVGERYGQGSSMDVCEPHPSNPTAMPYLDKSAQMKAALVGCRSSEDGIIDKWASRVNFSVYDFGSGTSLRVPFDTDKATLEAGIMGIPASGSTNMTRGIKDHSMYFRSYFDGDNSLACRPNFLVMLSDGNPNGGGATYDFECTSPVESTYVSANQPWFGSDYVQRNEDILCSVPGNQNIATYTIGFGQPGDFSPTNLQRIAEYGSGEYYYASDREQLNESFEQIISAIVSRSALFFAPIAIQSESLFAGNYAYAAAFKPQEGGPWRGTVKKHCVVPDVLAGGAYDTSIDTCLFLSTDGTTLETNPRVMDLWTGLRTVAADIGGSGDVIHRQMQSYAGGTPSAPYWGHRNILTWRAGTSGYVPVDRDHLTREDTWTNACEHDRLLNMLHGYTYDAHCGTGEPVAVSAWPLGDPVGFSPTLLLYGPCQDGQDVPIPGNCYVVAGMNDGMVHIFDTADGSEKSALVPAELWGPNGIAHSSVADLPDQPNLTFTHRFLVDGDARLLHKDTDADGYIDANETAQLIFGLGRGGAAYYAVDVAVLAGGVLDATNNPVHPITVQPGTAFAELRDTWAAPWVGQLRQAGALYDVAVFPSGHIPNFDFPLGTPEVSVPQVDLRPDRSSPRTVQCGGADGFAQMNGYLPSWCDDAWISGCQSSGPCYDAGGTPLDIALPIRLQDPDYEAAAMRLRFGGFEIDSNDVVRIEDESGNVVGEYRGSELSGGYTPWVYDDKLVVHLLTDGNDTRDRGFQLSSIDWIPTIPGSASVQAPGRISGFTLGVDHRPTIYVADVDKWNSSSKKPFTDAVDGGGLRLRITNDCNGIDVAQCLDASAAPDLAHMVCPISAEVSAYTEADELRALYWGDECGQIFKAWSEDGGTTWTARRLINLNGGDIGVDQNHRKIFRRLDLVLSTCPGQRVVGIYFGTGNQQRPTSKSELTDTSITDGHDLVGVVWDATGLPENLTEEELEDVTAGPARSATEMLADGKYGWRLSLTENERMLRDPLVFDKVAYFKTFEPTVQAAECGGSAGVDRIYAVDNCDGGAVRDLDGDGTVDPASEREVWTGETEVGGGLFFYTPKDSPVLVSHADIASQQSAQLNQRTRSRPGLYLWREF